MSTIDYVRKLGYPNVQEYINSGPYKTIDRSRMKKMATFMLNNGWVELMHEDIESHDFTARDLIKYITNEKPKDGGIRNVNNYNTDQTETMVYGSSANKFRSGGWVIAQDGELITGDGGKKYMLYKPHNLSQPPISIQLENIERMYVMSASILTELKNKRPVVFNRPKKKTKYPVCLQDSNGDTVTVYYASDITGRRRFMGSKKFSRATNIGWSFRDSDPEQ